MTLASRCNRLQRATAGAAYRNETPVIERSLNPPFVTPTVVGTSTHQRQA
jgi:hypothetical protein